MQEQLKVDQPDQFLCLQEQQQQRAPGASSPGHNHSSHPQGAQKHRHQEDEALTRLENCPNSTERHDEEDGEWFLVGQCSLSLHRFCPRYNADFFFFFLTGGVSLYKK